MCNKPLFPIFLLLLNSVIEFFSTLLNYCFDNVIKPHTHTHERRCNFVRAITSVLIGLFLYIRNSFQRGDWKFNKDQFVSLLKFIHDDETHRNASACQKNWELLQTNFKILIWSSFLSDLFKNVKLESQDVQYLNAVAFNALLWLLCENFLIHFCLFSKRNHF